MTSLGGSMRWGSFIDLREAKQWIRFDPTNQVGDFDSNLQRIVDMACTQVQTHLGRPVAPTTFTERHDGWSGEYIMLRWSPFLSLVSCKEWQSSGGMVSLPESTPENPVDGIQIDYATARIMRTFAGYSWPRPFFPGSRNIEISYVAGFNPIPPDIWTATAELIGHWWDNTQSLYNKGASRGQEGDGSPVASGLWQGLPNRIAALLAPYRTVGIA